MSTSLTEATNEGLPVLIDGEENNRWKLGLVIFANANCGLANAELVLVPLPVLKAENPLYEFPFQSTVKALDPDWQ